MKPVITKRVRKILKSKGCVKSDAAGSHEKWTTPGGLPNTIVDDRTQSPGVLRNVQRVFDEEFRCEVARKGVETMRATVDWDGYCWVAVPVGGGVTQAKRLDQLPERIVEVVKLMSGVDIDVDDVELEIDFPRADVAVALRAERQILAAAEQSLIKNTKAVAVELSDNGVCLRDIAHLTGISHQRAQQLVAASR